MMYTLEFSFHKTNFSSTITNEDIEFGASSRPTDSASHMQGSVTFFQQSIYKNTAAGRKIRHQVYANTNSTTYAISSNANFQMMQIGKRLVLLVG